MDWGLVFCPWPSDDPNPALKRLTISFLALEVKGLLVPCIRRQRFTRIAKAPKRISCHLELGNLKLCSDHVQTYVHRGENRYLYKIVAVVIYISADFRLSHETSSQRISCLLKISDSFGFSFLGLLLSIFSLRVIFVGFFFAPGLKTIKISRVTYRKNDLIYYGTKTNFSVPVRKV